MLKNCHKILKIIIKCQFIVLETKKINYQNSKTKKIYPLNSITKTIVKP